MKVEPIKTAAGYIGGKRKLAGRLCRLIEQVPHKLYAEPFCGMGNVFFCRTNIPKVEVINDRSGDISNFFRILQRHYPQFMDTLKFQITSRREFERLKACEPTTLTDLERAARFFTCKGRVLAGRSLVKTSALVVIVAANSIFLNSRLSWRIYMNVWQAW